MGPAAQERGKNEKVNFDFFCCQILVLRVLQNSFAFIFFSSLVSFVFPDLFSADRFTSETSMSLALSSMLSLSIFYCCGQLKQVSQCYFWSFGKTKKPSHKNPPLQTNKKHSPTCRRTIVKKKNPTTPNVFKCYYIWHTLLGILLYPC